MNQFKNRDRSVLNESGCLMVSDDEIFRVMESTAETLSGGNQIKKGEILAKLYQDHMKVRQQGAQQ